MANESCPLPGDVNQDDRQVIKRLLRGGRIAVVGMSDNPMKPSFYVSQYMKEHAGKEIVPVNPAYQSVLGLTCYPSLEAVPGKIDLVNVFRRPEFCPEIVRAAIMKGVSGIWLQAGIVSDEARRLAREAGIDYIEDRCIMVEHRLAR